MKICIVEDEVIVSYDLANRIRAYSKDIEVILTKSFKEGMETLHYPYDAYILDIRLNDGDGIFIGEKLQSKKIPFIYLTANNEVDVIKKAVQTKPVAYISKPFKERDIIAGVELLKGEYNNNSILIQTSNGKVEIKTNDILYCQADDVYVHIFIKDKKFTKRSTLKKLSNLLPENFIRVHRSYVVNKDKITAKKVDSIFINDQSIPLSRNFKDLLS